MMYDEFLELTNQTENDIALSQYQKDIEPAYTFIYAWENKQQFCAFYKAFGYQVVREISENIMRKFQLEKLLSEKKELAGKYLDLLG